jgi:hypothetical protein
MTLAMVNPRIKNNARGPSPPPKLQSKSASFIHTKSFASPFCRMEYDEPGPLLKRKHSQTTSDSAKKAWGDPSKTHNLTPGNEMTGPTTLTSTTNPPQTGTTSLPTSAQQSSPIGGQFPPQCNLDSNSWAELWGESTPLNPTPNASTTSSIEAIIKLICSTTLNKDIKEDVAKVLDLYIKAKNKVYKCTVCVLAIELVVLRDAVAKVRDGGTVLEEEDLVILVIVAENIKEDWNTVCNFFNNTWALDTDNTVLFLQSCKRLAIFAFTTKEGRTKAISMIKDANKDWYIVPGIETLKQSNCLFNTPHTMYIYAPDLPLKEL